MRIQVTRGGEAYRFPRSAIMAGAALLALGLLVAVLSRKLSGPVICPFRLVTGLPCPTCGLVRTAGHLLRGEVAAAFRTNPLDALTMLAGVPVAFGIWLANRLGGWAVRFSVGRRERALVWLLVLSAFAVNWVYVLTHGS